ncbi:Pilus assembly protein PilW [Luteimonas sp. 9C]|uniref:PilW family protein n=1 Tax=Luteimonas sp. 9C TaxID=2653148 RepID=UPI0012F3D33B|nr:PilW family protein [Luteimonas sp. 9C]VXB45333.1 Pilus assembly protein PilW [Luteimonas sp. 9C]
MRFPSPKRARGVSLIEMMIALAIGTFLILGLARVFSASRTAYQLSEGVSRVQENGRFAIDFIQRDLRMVGHMGCVNDQAHLQNVGALLNRVPAGTAGANSGVNFPLGIQAYEAAKTSATTMNLGTAANTWTPALPGALAALNPAPSPGSDVLQLRFLASEGAAIQAVVVSGTTSTITVAPGRWDALTQDGVVNPTMFGIADCSFVDLFLPSSTNAATRTVTVNAALDRYTPQPAGQTMLYRLESLVYYVAPNASGQRSLWRARALASGFYGPAEELVEGIESLQLQLGLDRNTGTMPAESPSGYVGTFVLPSAMATTEPASRSVGAVRLGVLASSPDRSASGQAPLGRSVLGVRFTPADATDTRYRFGYESTIAMRNRLYGN